MSCHSISRANTQIDQRFLQPAHLIKKLIVRQRPMVAPLAPLIPLTEAVDSGPVASVAKKILGEVQLEIRKKITPKRRRVLVLCRQGIALMDYPGLLEPETPELVSMPHRPSMQRCIVHNAGVQIGGATQESCHGAVAQQAFRWLPKSMRLTHNPTSTCHGPNFESGENPSPPGRLLSGLANLTPLN